MLTPYRYFLSGQIGDREAFPSGKLNISWDRETEDLRFGHKKTAEGNLIFSGDDYSFLLTLEKTIYRCDNVQLRVDKLCDGEYKENWLQGYLVLNDGNWDLDKCTVEIKVTLNDKYSTYDSISDTEFNLFDLVPASQRQIINLFQGSLEYKECNLKLNTAIPVGCRPDASLGWINYYYTSSNGMSYRSYVRRVVNGIGSLPIIYNRTVDSGVYSYSILGKDFTAMDNGMKLSDVLSSIATTELGLINCKSDFFQINPINTSNINYVTGKDTKVNNLILFQKADAKRPWVDNSTKATTTTEDILNGICTIFNCNWDIDEDTNQLIIEHVSWFQRTKGIDLTIERFKKNVKFSRKYSYNKDNLPNTETFAFMEQNSIDFVGLPIVYSGSCVSYDKTNGKKEYKADVITTDLYHVLNHNDIYDDTIDNDGFFLAACDENYNLIQVDPVLFDIPSIAEGEIVTGYTNISNIGGVLNNYLSWANLHNDFFKWNRILTEGSMNGIIQPFETTVYSKEQDSIYIPLCCYDDFDAEQTIKSALGENAIVNSASLDINANLLELKLIYQQSDDLTGTDNPIANNDTVNVNPETNILIDVLKNDYSVNSQIDPSTVEIITQPNYGIVSIESDGKLNYTPNDGINSKTDRITYSVKDINGNESNYAVCTINILSGAKANDDSYNCLKNKTLNVSSPSVLANDTGDNIQVISFGATGTHGGNLIIETSGSLRYTPATDFVGSEDFTYSIKDSNGAISSATITINVLDLNTIYVKPVVETISSETLKSTCSGNTINSGYSESKNLSAEFYSDEAGTIPLDVTGLGIVLVYRYTYTDNLNELNNSDSTGTTEGSGLITSVSDYISEYQDAGCGASNIFDNSSQSYLIEGNGYTLI